MSSVEEQLAKQAKSAKAPVAVAEPEFPAHIQARFKGTIYIGTGQGNETEPFDITVRVPLTWLEMEGYVPNVLFATHYAKKVFKDKKRFGGVQDVQLMEVIGELPSLPLDSQLNWTADWNELKALSDKHTKKAVKPELYPKPSDLRGAIRAYLRAPEAFKKQQQKREASPKMKQRAMNDELAQLGYV